MLAGVGVLALSGVGFFLNSLVLILMLLPGLFIIMIGITARGKPLTGWGRGLGSRTGEFSPTGRKYREAKEVEEEKKRRDRESGAAD
jgi:hypothetical protein